VRLGNPDAPNLFVRVCDPVSARQSLNEIAHSRDWRGNLKCEIIL
jgi:hypothetical protein